MPTQPELRKGRTLVEQVIDAFRLNPEGEIDLSSILRGEDPSSTDYTRAVFIHGELSVRRGFAPTFGEYQMLVGDHFYQYDETVIAAMMVEFLVLCQLGEFDPWDAWHEIELRHLQHAKLVETASKTWLHRNINQRLK